METGGFLVVCLVKLDVVDGSISMLNCNNVDGVICLVCFIIYVWCSD
jgi:hypothetical protein